jgi:hypothetical protein
VVHSQRNQLLAKELELNELKAQVATLHDRMKADMLVNFSQLQQIDQKDMIGAFRQAQKTAEEHQQHQQLQQDTPGLLLLLNEVEGAEEGGELLENSPEEPAEEPLEEHQRDGKAAWGIGTVHRTRGCDNALDQSNGAEGAEVEEEGEEELLVAGLVRLANEIQGRERGDPATPLE